MFTTFLHSLRTRTFQWISSLVLVLLDCIGGFIAYRLVLYGLFDPPDFSLQDHVTLFLGIQGLWLLILFLGNQYSGAATLSRFIEVQQILRITFSVIVLAVFVDALVPVAHVVRPGAIFKYWLALITSLVTLRLAYRSFQKYLLRRGIGRHRTIILGVNKRGLRVAEEIRAHHQQGFDLVGFVRGLDDPVVDDPGPYSVLGDETQVKDLIRQHQISDVVLALERPEHARLMTAINNVNGAPVSIKIVPDLYEVISGLARTQQLYGLPLLDVNPNLDTLYHRYFKRLFDFVVAGICLALFLPFWGIIAVLIKLNSSGPVLYRQTRVGRNTRQFRIFKFRSMVANAEAETGPVWAAEDDARITNIGRWLRRFRLDEVPQLLNVLTGDMSIVGPRPERPYFIDQLLQEYPFYYRRHKVRPGITGWAQIKHPYDRDIEDVRQKLKYDFYYIESLSFILDMKIVASTLWVMISGQGR